MQARLRVDGQGDFRSGIEVIPAVSTDIPLLVQGAASQSANLQEWKRSDDQHVMSVDPEGNVLISGGLSDLSNQITMTIKATGADSRINLLNYLDDVAYVHMQGGQRSAKFGQGSAWSEYTSASHWLYANNKRMIALSGSADSM